MVKLLHPTREIKSIFWKARNLNVAVFSNNWHLFEINVNILHADLMITKFKKDKL